MAIENIKTYLAPLTNNERAVLLHAAGARYWVTRTKSVEQDLSMHPHRDTTVPAAQIEKAAVGLVEKGYATWEPLRGNYYYQNPNWRNGSTLDGHGFVTGRKAAPYHKMFAEKQAGKWARVDWTNIARIVPVEDVKTAVREYREAERAAEEQSKIAEAESADSKTEYLISSLEHAAQEFIAARADGEDMMSKGPHGWYRLHEAITEMESIIGTLDRWKWKRDSVETEAETLRRKVAA